MLDEIIGMSNYLMSMEVAEMLEMRHNEILRKIDGGKDRKGYAQILTEHHLALSDYFVRSSYQDNSGKQNRCYLITRLGCEFLANKFTGEKGIVFTAKYVKRFHEMEEELKENRHKSVNYANMPQAPELDPNRELSWYERNNERMNMICNVFGITKKELCSRILYNLDSKFDLKGAKKLHYELEGRAFQYSTDIINYYGNLAEAADLYLDKVEEGIKAKFPKYSSEIFDQDETEE